MLLLLRKYSSLLINDELNGPRSVQDALSTRGRVSTGRVTGWPGKLTEILR